MNFDLLDFCDKYVVNGNFVGSITCFKRLINVEKDPTMTEVKLL